MLGGTYGGYVGGHPTDAQFELLYGITRLAQAPPSSPKGGARQDDMVELHLEVGVGVV